MTIIKTTVAGGSDHPERDAWVSLKRGWTQKCPSCAKGNLYASYLKVNDACPQCAEALHHQRADDAPPYFTMFITGHVVIGLILWMEQTFAPPTWVHLAIALPMLVLLSLWLLPRIKGALIGYQWANRMHGFGDRQVEGSDVPPHDPLPAVPHR